MSDSELCDELPNPTKRYRHSISLSKEIDINGRLCLVTFKWKEDSLGSGEPVITDLSYEVTFENTEITLNDKEKEIVESLIADSIE